MEKPLLGGWEGETYLAQRNKKRLGRYGGAPSEIARTI